MFFDHDYYIGSVHVNLSQSTTFRKRSRQQFENDSQSKHELVSDEDDDDQVDFSDLTPFAKKTRLSAEQSTDNISPDFWQPNMGRNFAAIQHRVEEATKEKQNKAIENYEHIRYIIPTIQTNKWTQTIANALLVYFRLLMWERYPDVPDEVIKREKWKPYSNGHYQRPWVKLNQQHMIARKKWQAKQSEIEQGLANESDIDEDPPARFINLYFVDFPEMLETWDKATVMTVDDVSLWCFGAKKDHWLSKIEIRKPTGKITCMNCTLILLK